ncbi:hypothetical protein BST27_16535 [Mycobacterium intermedium]|uniref:Uncharacterized protein n=1 Tax=Mycobacterium intermedium TaxID=28445 RepID=A0A1E3SNH4_MYCIE|nr:hypothetical protein BHQ20_01340 [Mycobacterium intermedium]OPE48329.1 hypothetical protein BV508_18350 [Mycobacterium intermedium]ORB02413.1 hypothetical protein BST27_16535 [Mycobacterium intermedium]
MVGTMTEPRAAATVISGARIQLFAALTNRYGASCCPVGRIDPCRCVDYFAESIVWNGRNYCW